MLIPGFKGLKATVVCAILNVIHIQIYSKLFSHQSFKLWFYCGAKCDQD